MHSRSESIWSRFSSSDSRSAEIFDLVPTDSRLFGHFEAETKSLVAESHLKAESIDKVK